MPVQPGIELTKTAILEKVTPEQIFEKYLGYEIDDSVFFVNPLRPDRRASCRFYYNSQGKLYFHDWGKYHWDCFAVVQYKFGLTFIEALRKIAHDFVLKEVEAKYFEQSRNIPVKQREEIQVSVREWTSADLDFWKQGNIDTEVLKWGRVYPLQSFWINKEWYKCWKVDPTYCYYFGNNLYKLYFPARKEGRFFQNINQLDDDLTQGWNLLPPTGDHCIITKSYKDVLSMHSFGIIADSVLSETHVIKPSKIEIYKQRYKNVYTLFDNDQTGRRLAIKYWQLYGIPYLMFPKGWPKDFFDNTKAFGPTIMKERIIQWKEQYVKAA